MKRLLVVVLLVTACSGPAAVAVGSPTSVPTAMATTIPDPLAARPTAELVTAEPTAAPTPEPTDYAVGDRMGFTSGSDNVIYVTVKAVKTFVQKYNDPDPGMKYVIADIALEGTSGETTVSAFDFSMTDADAYVYEIQGMFKDPSLPYDNTLTAGKKVRGWLTFEVPKAMKAGWVVFADSTVAFRLP